MPSLKKAWTRSSLSTAHHVDYDAAMEPVLEHEKAVQLIVNARGGLHAIKLKTAAIAIQLLDAFNSWRYFRRPTFALLQPTSLFMSLRNHISDPAAIALSRELASGFDCLDSLGSSSPLQNLLAAVRNTAIISTDFDQWSRKTPNKPDMVHIQFTRWCILHDLLSLPDLSETIHSSEDNRLYEIMLLSTFAYFLFTLTPIPQAGTLPKKISSKLLLILESCTSNQSTNQAFSHRHRDLIRWSIILGGMCAYISRDPELAGVSATALVDSYAELTQRIIFNAGFVPWHCVVALLKPYLWLERECNESGEAFWRYACQYPKRQHGSGVTGVG